MSKFSRAARAVGTKVGESPVGKSILNFLSSRLTDNYVGDFDLDKPGRKALEDPSLQAAWVNICIYYRARNMQRARLKIYKKDSREQLSGPFFNFLQFPNPSLSLSSLLFMSYLWYDTEGEFFWLFDSTGGVPTVAEIANPRNMEYSSYEQKWYYQNPVTNQRELRDPMSFLHVYEPNIWNTKRGIPPMAALAMELEQSHAVSTEHLAAVRNSAIPEGVLKTDQRISQDQAKELRERWERDHGRNKKNSKIAVLGSGATFQAINDNLLKYLDLHNLSKNAIITKYGLSLKALNSENSGSALSGNDTGEQYKAIWAQTLIPTLDFIAEEMTTKLLRRFGNNNLFLKYDYTLIPDLQEDENELHKRLREDIRVNLITINEARQEVLHKDPVPWGDKEFTVGKDPNASQGGDAEPGDAGRPNGASGKVIDTSYLFRRAK